MPLRIAIIGAGISSVCLERALSKHTHLSVRVFEASTVLREDGAGIGLGSNAQEALRMMGPGMRAALDEAGGTVMEPSTRVMMGEGPDAGRCVGDITPAIPVITVQRGAFLRALRKLEGGSEVTMGKRLEEIQEHEEFVRLLFEDGSMHEADAVIGCDGIESTTRRYILGPDHPAARPKYTEGRVHRVVIPIEKARPVFGEEYSSLKIQHGWVGEGAFLLTDLNDDGQSMQVIAGWSNKGPWPHQAPFAEWPKDDLKSDLESWGYIGEAMTKIFLDEPKLFAAGQRVHVETPTYTKGRVCVVGDAAESFPPFMGAGAGQAIEDALMLSTLLGASYDREDIVRALDTYDAMRRPRRHDIAVRSQQAALLLTGRAPAVGMSVEGIAKELPSWGSTIFEYDLQAAQMDGLRRMGEV